MALDDGNDLLADADRLARRTPRSLAELQELALEMRSLFGGPEGSDQYLHCFIERLCEGVQVLRNQESGAVASCLAA